MKLSTLLAGISTASAIVVPIDRPQGAERRTLEKYDIDSIIDTAANGNEIQVRDHNGAGDKREEETKHFSIQMDENLQSTGEMRGENLTRAVLEALEKLCPEGMDCTSNRPQEIERPVRYVSENEHTLIQEGRIEIKVEENQFSADLQRTKLREAWMHAAASIWGIQSEQNKISHANKLPGGQRGDMLEMGQVSQAIKFLTGDKGKAWFKVSLEFHSKSETWKVAQSETNPCNVTVAKDVAKNMREDLAAGFGVAKEQLRDPACKCSSDWNAPVQRRDGGQVGWHIIMSNASTGTGQLRAQTMHDKIYDALRKACKPQMPCTNEGVVVDKNIPYASRPDRNRVLASTNDGGELHLKILEPLESDYGKDKKDFSKEAGIRDVWLNLAAEIFARQSILYNQELGEAKKVIVAAVSGTIKFVTRDGIHLRVGLEFKESKFRGDWLPVDLSFSCVNSTHAVMEVAEKLHEDLARGFGVPNEGLDKPTAICE